MSRCLLATLCCALPLLGMACVDAPRLSEPDEAPVAQPAPDDGPAVLVLKPARVFDGVTAQVHENWVVVVRGDKIASAGPADKVAMPANARVFALPNATLLPGLIDAHTHVLLHP